MRRTVASIVSVVLFLCPYGLYAQSNIMTGGGRKIFHATGTTNHARQFNGTSDSLQSVSALSSLSGLNAVSLSFWMYWDTFANTDNLAFESSANANSNAGAFIVNPNSSGGCSISSGLFEFAAATGTSCSLLVCTFNRPTSGAWHQYVLTMNFSAGTCGAYVDGSIPTGLTVVGSSTGTFSSQILNVMSRNNSSLFAAGRMSEIAIFNGTVNSSDASLLASCGRPTSVSSATLIYYWPIKQVSPETPTTGSINLAVNGTTNVASNCSF